MKHFKIKPYDEPRKPQTPAQREASSRNFGIFQLRGLYSLCYRLNEPYRSIAQGAVDADLIARGAEAETARQKRLMEGLAETDIPF